MTTLASLIMTLALALTTPCASEDSMNCTWNADVQGNGTGISFVDINGTAYSI